MSPTDTDETAVTELAFGERLGFVDAWCDVNGLIAGLNVAMSTGILFMRVPQLRRVTDPRTFLMPKSAQRHMTGIDLPFGVSLPHSHAFSCPPELKYADGGW